MTRRALAPLLLFLGPAAACRADELIIPLDRPPLLPPTAVVVPLDPAPPKPNPNRIRLFRMQPGFLYGPPGLDLDDFTAAAAVGPQPDDNLEWLQLAVGGDNPFFDARRPGDPGGVGYLKVHSQVQLIDSRTTACSINLQAVTPAGRDQDGLADGPTVLTPGIAVYQELLDDGTALQGFVGKQVPFGQGPFLPRGGPLQRGLQYGLAVQRPLWAGGTDGSDSCFFFLGALGRVRFDDAAGPTPAWDVMPGLHYRVSPTAWLAGSLILPVNNIGKPDGTGWQFTLSWQF
jgi:hypothetical protein